MRKAVTCLALVPMLASCGASGTRVAGPGLDVQRSALFACKDALGVGGQSRISIMIAQNSTGPRIEQAVIQPHDQVTPALAAQINQCAVDSVTTSAILQTPATPAAEYRAQPRQTQYQPVGQSALNTSSPLCPPGVYGLYKGDLLC